MKVILLSLAATTFLFNGYSQSISGIIKDSKTNEALGYATIGVIGKNIGTAANGKGEFTINMTDAVNTDTVKISYIGYKSMCCNVEDFKKTACRRSCSEILLAKEDYLLSTITIKPSNTRSIKVGSGLKIPGYAECFKTDVSTEIGAFYTTKKAFIPTSVILKVKSSSFDSVIFALHIYRVGKDSSLLEVMTKQTLQTAYKTAKKFEVEFDLNGCISKELIGNYVISFSLVSAHGKGKIVLPLYYGNGYWRKLCESKIERIPAKVGISFKGFSKY